MEKGGGVGEGRGVFSALASAVVCGDVAASMRLQYSRLVGFRVGRFRFLVSFASVRVHSFASATTVHPLLRPATPGSDQSSSSFPLYPALYASGSSVSIALYT